MQVPSFDLISPAYAQETTTAVPADAAVPPPPGGMFGGSQMILFLVIMAVFYFLLIRPQDKKLKEHKKMLDALRRGDRVVTSGGIVGTVIKLEGDEYVTVEIAENVRVKVVRSTISSVVSKTEPVKTEGDGAQAANDSAKPD